MNNHNLHTDLFTAALGLQSPWRVDDIRFDPEQGRIDFDVSCQSSRLVCPVSAARLGAEPAEDLGRWVSWARRSRLKPFKRLGATVREYLQGIVASYQHGLSNGTAESINSKIQAAMARVRGFRSLKNLYTMLYLVAGRLSGLPSSPYAARSAAAV